MERARHVVWVGAAVAAVLIIAGYVIVNVLSNPDWYIVLDVVWKVFVLLLLLNISGKLGHGDHGRR